MTLETMMRNLVGFVYGDIEKIRKNENKAAEKRISIEIKALNAIRAAAEYWR